MALYCHFAFLTLCVICCRVAQYVGENIEPAISITPLGLSVHGARSIYIYRLAPCTENCSQKISKTFSHNNLEDVLLFCTFEPKKCKCAFRVAVSACTLKILCCGYNMATIKKDKKIKDYDTRSCSEMVIFLSLRKQGCKSASYAIYTLYYTSKSFSVFLVWFIAARCQGFYSYVSFRATRIRLSSTTTLLLLVVTKSPSTE